jgi:exodeoxyribonuclease-3
LLRIVSANLNGIRSADKKGFLTWMEQSQADVVCVQELKAQEPDLSARMLAPAGYHGYFHPAEKKGYSGVGLYCRQQPDRVTVGLGIESFDAEGRFLRADFGRLSVISLYLPSGSSSEERQQVKFDFMAAFLPVLESLMCEGREVVVCGDWNIAHQEIDLKNWKGNLKNSGFLPEERAWFGDLIARVGWVDVWRRLYPEVPGYTWWSNRGQAYAKDVGWRIDYQMATAGLAGSARLASVYKQEKFSDHAPLIVDYDFSATAEDQA